MLIVNNSLFIKRNNIIKHLMFFLFFVSVNFFSQTNISGYLVEEEGSHNIEEVKLVQIDDLDINAANSTKIIASSKLDSKGFFHFNEQLPFKSKLYYLSAKGKYINIKSKAFLLGNQDSVFFQKSSPPLTQYKISSLTNYEWKKMLDFQNGIERKNKFLDKIREYSKDSLQILAVKLISLKELDKKHLLEKDIELNQKYYFSLLKEFKESDINSSEYLFFELKLSKFQLKEAEGNFVLSKVLNIILGCLILAFFLFRFNKSKQNLPTLSKQELTIKNLILQQKSNKEIASDLFISVSTVKSHITNLYKKLQVTNRNDLIAKFKE